MSRPKRGCRVCGEREALVRAFELTVHSRGVSVRWHFTVCRDCWRAMEALLDSGSDGVQNQLGYHYPERPSWVW